MEKLNNIHPGEILIEEFLIPMEISAYRLSKDLEIPQTRISQIIKGKRRITADTALRLGSYFGNSAKFWLGLQDDFDIEAEEKNQTVVFEKIKQIRVGRASKQAV
ncbi:MAG: HigA family addiction module antidote protein [Chlorobium sp.]|jgi:antitoxin HigA-1|nr:HigA family addiction module antidote protein [Chlorobium sp.]